MGTGGARFQAEPRQRGQFGAESVRTWLHLCLHARTEPELGVGGVPRIAGSEEQQVRETGGKGVFWISG